jgi:hypothetical protein
MGELGDLATDYFKMLVRRELVLGGNGMLVLGADIADVSWPGEAALLPCKSGQKNLGYKNCYKKGDWYLFRTSHFSSIPTHVECLSGIFVFW